LTTAVLSSSRTRWRKVAATLPVLAMLLATLGADLARSQPASEATADRVTFPSADGHTTLVGYVFHPAVESGKRVTAVVMMHGRQGAYSTAAHGVYDATTLSQRHQFWGRFWAAQGYMAVLVDGFGPRGYPQGFGRHTYDTRPDELNEVTVRPFDAYGALAFLRSLPAVDPDRIGLQGWSNGGSATLAAMAPDAPGLPANDPARGFRAALAFYPACGLKDHFAATRYQAYAPLRVYIGTADEEVSPQKCRSLLTDAGGDVRIHFYGEATHDFDDPGPRRQQLPANAEARSDVIERARSFFAKKLGASPGHE
jgi:dienelactone hydrolase